MLCVDELGFYKRLTGVGFKLQPGAFVGILGPNGSGKSTLLSILAGLLPGFQGQVRLDGNELERYSLAELGHLRALLPQRAEAVLSMPGVQVLELGVSALGGGGDWINTARELSNRLQLGALLTRDFTTLSGGEQQRVMLARTLLQIWPSLNPKGRLLLLDEPLAGLDLHHQWLVLELLEALADQGITILLSIHDFNLAGRFTRQMMFLKGGQLVAEGPPSIMSCELLREVFSIETLEIEVNGQSQFIPIGV